MLKRALASKAESLTANHVYTVRRGLAKGLKRRGGLGFVPRVGARSREELFLQRLDLTGQTVYDVGGMVGIFSLFFARQVGASGQVVTFEPNPHNHPRIVENLGLNGFTNVEVRLVALGAKPGRSSLVFPSDSSGRGSLVADMQAQIRRWNTSVTAIEVDVDTLDHQISLGLPEPDFVKLDVEGLEFDVLQGMAQTIAKRRPALQIELHGAGTDQKLENATAVIEYLWRAGYRVLHVESGETIRDKSSIHTAVRGHLYCR